MYVLCKSSTNYYEAVISLQIITLYDHIKIKCCLLISASYIPNFFIVFNSLNKVNDSKVRK